jgi:glycosyltransferase involved in cell wall biosynthesis
MVRELGIGGCERDVSKAARYLDRSQFEPHVGCFRDQGLRRGELEAAGIPVVRFPVTSFRSASLFKGLLEFRRYVRLHRIALVHAFDVPTNVFAAAASRVAGLPFIASQLWFRESIPSLWSMHILSLRRANAVVVNSHAVYQWLAREHPQLRQRLHVSHNGVETAIFHPSEDEARAAGPVTIGAVCALRSEKRLDLLLDAFAKLRAGGYSAKLLIVGSGPVLAALEAQRGRLGIAGDCTFEPATQDVAGWMRRMDVFVLCSDSESFPNALLEAMACGCCPVGSRVGGVPELIVENETGLLFEPGKAGELAAGLMRLAGNPQLRLRLGKHAARRAREEFSMEAAAARLGGLYRGILTRTG